MQNHSYTAGHVTHHLSVTAVVYDPKQYLEAASNNGYLICDA